MIGPKCPTCGGDAELLASDMRKDGVVQALYSCQKCGTFSKVYLGGSDGRA
jgi:uncharacterized Zn finger protein